MQLGEWLYLLVWMSMFFKAYHKEMKRTIQRIRLAVGKAWRENSELLLASFQG